MCEEEEIKDLTFCNGSSVIHLLVICIDCDFLLFIVINFSESFVLVLFQSI